MDPLLETAVLNQSEETLAELVNAFLNVGLSKGQVAVMLRARADILTPPIIVEHATVQ